MGDDSPSIPTICNICGRLSFIGDALCTCAHIEPAPPRHDEVVVLLLDRALPVEQAAVNLRNVVRTEGESATLAQLDAVAEALTLDIHHMLTTNTITHQHIPMDEVRRTVQAHIIFIKDLSGAMTPT